MLSLLLPTLLNERGVCLSFKVRVTIGVKVGVRIALLYLGTRFKIKINNSLRCQDLDGGLERKKLMLLLPWMFGMMVAFREFDDTLFGVWVREDYLVLGSGLGSGSG